jgi:hypothetical protein
MREKLWFECYLMLEIFVVECLGVGHFKERRCASAARFLARQPYRAPMSDLPHTS